jgi:UDP-3-O-[3-hydroxymyristoyl] N-acetylglucosamine deacetylase
MIRLEGRGLHRGAPSAVSFRAIDGRTTIGRGNDDAALADLVVEGSDRCSVAVLPHGTRIVGIEHLLSAIVGAGVFYGVHIEIDGDEVPLLDGGATSFFDALSGFSPRGDRVRVLREAKFEAHGAVLSVAPLDGTDISVDVSFDSQRFGRPLAGSASFNGDRAFYRAHIATARTFGAARELDALRARGLAAYLPEGSVVALDVDDPRYAPRDPEEPIRHKLLDVLGDLAALGGPFHGRARIVRPSHLGTRATLELALSAGVIQR